VFVIKLVQNRFGVTQIAVFGGQINGGVCLDSLHVGTLAGPHQGKQYKFIGPPEFDIGIPADFLFVNFDIVNRSTYEYAVIVYIHP